MPRSDLKDRLIEALRGDQMVRFLEGLGFAFKREGREYKCLCPFHADSHPSFTINVDKRETGLFHCFPCGWDGDVFEFVKQSQGLADFPSTLKFIAGRIGIDASNPAPAGAIAPGARRASKKKSFDVEAYKERRLEQSKAIWGEATTDHPRAVAYLEARGVRVEWLPNGKLPNCVRFHEQCPSDVKRIERGQPYEVRCPALVFSVVDDAGKLSGLQRVFVDPAGQPKKHDLAGPGEEKKKDKVGIGALKGRAIRFSRTCPGGVLILAEGPETALAAMAASGFTAWSTISAGGLRDLVLPDELVKCGDPAAVSVIIIAADLDKSKTGQNAAAEKAQELLERYPWLTVRVAIADQTVAPSLVTPEGKPKVGKSVDALDVLAACGREATRAWLLDGIDLDEARNRAMSWRPSAGDPHGMHTYGGDAPPTGTGGTVGAGDEDEGGGRGDRRYMPMQEVDRAALFIDEAFGAPTKKRAGSCPGLCYWNGQFWRFDGVAWFPIGRDEAVRGQARRWMRQFWTVKGKDRHETPFEANTPVTNKLVECVRDELLIDNTGVDKCPTRFWLRPMYHGERIDLARPAWSKWTDEPPKGYPSIDRLIVTEDGMLDVDAFVAGRVRRLEPTPLLFSPNRFPHKLPWRAMMKAQIDAEKAGPQSGADAWEKLLIELCPNWLRHVNSALSDGSNYDQVDTLQELFGYYLLPDISVESGNIAFLHGPEGWGKGTTIEGLIAMLGGPWNYVSSALDRLTDKFHFRSWINKLTAIFGDAHVPGKADGAIILDAIKRISGGDGIGVDQKFKDELPSVKMTARLVIAVNEMPNLIDRAIQRRMVVLDFRRAPGGQDPRHKAAIAREGLGIMVWALLGLRRLLSRTPVRFSQPEDGRTVMNAFQRSASHLSTDFIGEYLQVGGADDYVTTGEIHAAYVRMCEDQKRPSAMNDATLMRVLMTPLRAAGWTGESSQRSIDGRRSHGYTGLRINQARMVRVTQCGAEPSIPY